LKTANIESKVIIHEGSSLQLTSSIVSTKLKPIQVFSVDGCHTYDCTLSDLHLAFDSVTRNGLVIVDDQFNSHWPGVSTGLGAFISQRKDVVVFAYGFNKTFLCFKDSYEIYYKIIEEYCASGKSCMIRQGMIGMSDKVWFLPG